MAPDVNSLHDKTVAQVQAFVADANRVGKSSGQNKWLSSLADHGWLGVDWPVVHHGTGWDRSQQLAWLTQMTIAGVPSPGEPFVNLAPLIIAVGSQSQQMECLPKILHCDAQWLVAIEGTNNLVATPVSDGWCLTGTVTLSHADPCAQQTYLCVSALDQAVSKRGECLHLFLLPPRLVDSLSRHPEGETTITFDFEEVFVDRKHILGLPGQAAQHIQHHRSMLHVLWELALATNMVKGLLEDSPDEALQLRLSELQIRNDILAGMFVLQRSPAVFHTVARKITTGAADLLMDSLGYYATLVPASGNTSNEPALPFQRERAMLSQLRQNLHLDDMINMDLLYREIEDRSPT